MKLFEDVSILYFSIIGSLLFVTIFPFYGVNAVASVTIDGNSYEVELQDGNTLESGNYIGGQNILTNEIKIATGRRGLLSFMNTCSHELRHLKYDLKDQNREDPLTTEEEHELMNGLGSNWFPWNWQKQCLSLVPERTGF